MRATFFLLAIAAFAVASPVPTEDGGIGAAALDVVKTGVKAAANGINDHVQEHWNEEALKKAKEEKEKNKATAAELKGKGMDAAGALKNLASGVAGLKKPSGK